MGHMHWLSRALLASSISSLTGALPASHGSGEAHKRAAPVGPPGASGSLYGSKDLAGYSKSNPITDKTIVIPPSKFGLAPGQTEDEDLGFYLNPNGVKNFQPIRGDKKAPTDPGPRTKEYETLNPDLYAPPGTDNSAVDNAKWPLGLSHNRHGSTPSAGWARQQNNDNIPAAKEMAGVDMHLEPNAYRELHWHKATEWSLILRGSARISAIDTDGRSFSDDVQEGDVWFFPAGIPHSIQALETGVEFLLVFDDGGFSEDGTFLASEVVQRFPKSVLAKDTRNDVSAFANIPDEELYIFPGTPAPKDLADDEVVGPAGRIPRSRTYSYHWSEQKPYTVPGGSVKILDTTTFPTTNLAAALVTIEPGGMREIHWHTTSDEWNYFLQGQARITVYAAPDASRTFDFSAGDVGYIPVPDAHYIENTGNETVVFLEMLKAPKFEDVSLGQWFGLTPPRIIEDTTGMKEEDVKRLPKVKPYLLPGNKDMLTTDFREEPM